MSIRQTAKELGVSRQFVYTLIERGQLHPVRNPLYTPGKGPVAISRAEVEALKPKPSTP